MFYLFRRETPKNPIFFKLVKTTKNKLSQVLVLSLSIESQVLVLFLFILDSTLQGREARSLGTFSSLASLSLVFHSTRDPTPDHVSPASDRSDGC